MKLVRFLVAALCGCSPLWSGCASQEARPDLAQIAAPDAGPSAPAATPAFSWPRSYTLGDTTLRVFEPQVEQWQGNQLEFRVAADATTPRAQGKARQDFGVFWATATAAVDRPARLVTLSDIRITRSHFPTMGDDGAAYREGLQQQFAGSTSIVALDLLQSSLQVSKSVPAGGVVLDNTPPAIIVSYSPAILIPVGGTPVIREVPDSRFERVLNTRALILRTHLDSTWYVHVYDGWMKAPSLKGPWTVAAGTPMDMDSVAERLAKAGQADLLDGGNSKPKPTLSEGAPVVYVRDSAAELIVFKGQPAFKRIAGTTLDWATNTAADVFRDTADDDYYLLISGRWYRGARLDTGPWTYVASTALPADFKRIPADSPAAAVLAAVAGTPQAEEALIANSIPQTATIPRQDGPTFKPDIDGAPVWQPIEGTGLQYVANSETPIIKTGDGALYALSAGVWFTATALDVEWSIATAVPGTIYDIPPSAKLYYVTFVHIYGVTDRYVYVGYTPGYLGTVVNADGVVVYGTGYQYSPWVGDQYYAAPETYGAAAQPVYNPATGMAYAYGMGLTTAAMMYDWGAPVYYTPYYYGYPCCGSTSANVYGHYGDTSFNGTQTWYDKSNGEYGVKGSGTYDNSRTGTTGTYSTNRYENPYQGTAGRSYDRTFDTAGGGSGEVNRDETYNANKNQTSYTASGSATTAGGSTINRSTDDSWGAQGDSTSHETSVYNANTGQTKTFDSGSDNGDHYASANGENYRNDGSGWQKQTDDGWQEVRGEDTSWADQAQQARAQGQARASSYSAGGFSNLNGAQGGERRFSGGSGDFGGDRPGDLGGSGGDRFGGGGGLGGGLGGGGGSRFGGGLGGGWGSHFGGGGFGGRFGGGHFGGFGGRR